MSSSGVGQYSARTRFREVAEQWHEEFEQLVTAGAPLPHHGQPDRNTLDRHEGHGVNVTARRI